MNNKKKIKKSTWLTLALFVYVSVMAFYFLPRNTVTSDMEKYITLSVSYIIVLILWFVLRRKEKLQERQEENKNKDKDDKEK